jgi:predicted nucleic-acid-binding protein
MRGVDTNVLVRYIANDDLKQGEAVEQLFQHCRTERETLFVPVIVICELIWVLERTYGQSKSQIIAVLENLLDLDILVFEQDSVIRQSLDQYRHGKASFPDYVLGEISRQAGCNDTISFDRALRGAPGFTIL